MKEALLQGQFDNTGFAVVVIVVLQHTIQINQK